MGQNNFRKYRLADMIINNASIICVVLLHSKVRYAVEFLKCINDIMSSSTTSINSSCSYNGIVSGFVWKGFLTKSKLITFLSGK